MERNFTIFAKRKKDLKLAVFTFTRNTFASLLAIFSVCSACSDLEFQDWSVPRAVDFIGKRPLPAKYVVIRDEEGRHCDTKISCMDALREMQRRDVDIAQMEGIDCNFIIDGLGGVYIERGWTYESTRSLFDVVICFIKPSTGPYPSEDQKHSIDSLLKCGKEQNKLQNDFIVNTKRSMHEGQTNPEISLQNYLDQKYGCPPGFFGRDCNFKCPSRCKSTCRGPVGRCTDGCLRPGMIPPLCKELCRRGTWGDICENTCATTCSQNACNPVSGDCAPCVDGYYGSQCNKRCFEGTYGPGCNKTCSSNCVDKKCNNVDGSCTCKPGFQPPTCKTTCAKGTYGQHCTKTCSSNCVDKKCNAGDGSCTCKPGFQPPTCKTTCSGETYGPDCNKTCSKNCLDKKCNAGDGSCTCKTGFQPPTCETTSRILTPHTPTCQPVPKCAGDSRSRRVLAYALKKKDELAVCIYLPAYIRCLQTAQYACQDRKTRDTQDKDFELSVRSRMRKLKALEIKYRIMCYVYGSARPKSFEQYYSGGEQVQGSCFTSCFLVSLFVSLMLTLQNQKMF